MAGAGDARDQVGMVFRDIAQDEERGADAGPIQQIEESSRGFHDPARQHGPVRGRERAVYPAHVKPLFHVNGHDVVRCA
jgi:hypothetical protein